MNETPVQSANVKATVSAVSGIAAAWIAAGSTGLLGDPLRHALTWLVLAVAMMRAAGLVAYLAASTCRPWTDPYSFGLHDRLLPTWRATGGDYILLEPTTSGAGEFLPPPCPWGQWMPLAPLATRPRSIPTPATPTSVRVFSVVHEDGPPELTQEGLPGGLRSFISAVQSSLDLSPEDGWPQQFVLRERWPAGRGCTNEFRVRQRNPGGHLAATLLRDGNGTTLAIDLRLMAPLATKGASDYLEELLSAVKALRCQLDSVSTTDALRYHGLPCPTAPTAERVLPLTEG